MKSFEKELNKFLLDGTFENNFDDAGNINLFTEPVDVNQEYISYSLQNWVYKNDQIESLYDVNISEFTIPTENVSVLVDNNVSQLTQENNSLKEQLNAIIDATNQNSSSALIDASKDVIVQLRIQLKEGKAISDFSDVFPYLKK